MDVLAIRYDPGAGAAYWRLTRQKITRTIAVTDAVNVDLGGAGSAAGIEVIGLPGEPEAAGLDLTRALAIITGVDAHLDANGSPDYLAQPLARDWARITKVCEEAGEVWKALSRLTGENPRKGACGSQEELLGELGDTASAALFAIQHVTKDSSRTWDVIAAALLKAERRTAEHANAAA